MLALDDAVDDLVHRPVLLVAAHLLDHFPGFAVALEDDEVRQDVKQPLGREQAPQALLGFVGKLCRSARPGVFPRAPLMARCTGRAVEQIYPVRHDREGVRVEKPRDFFLILLDLVERLPGLVFVRERALTLDDDQRNAIDVDNQVGPAGGLRNDGQLFGDGEGVVLGMEEVDRLDRLPLGFARDGAAVVAAEDARPAFIVLDAEQFVIGRAGYVFRDFVEALDSFEELVAEDDLVESVAGDFGFLAREEGVVHRHQRIDRRRDGEDFLGAL